MSCGLGGEIPSTFANLQNLRIMLRGHHFQLFILLMQMKILSWAQLTIDMLGFQVDIRQSFHWKDTRLHWKLDKANISVSHQNFWLHLQVYFTWMMSCSYLQIFMHSSKAEKCGYYNTIVDKPVKCFCRRFEGNSFEGPIPSSFSYLTSLQSL